MQNNWKPVIGLEVHVQLSTESKIFSADRNSFGQSPNRNIGPITLAHPGTLPVLNEKVVDYAIRMGLALDCDISKEMTFDRKNYFYPDLPKGFQITQDATPICKGGGLELKMENGETSFVSLTKIHLEEDAGKSIHEPGEDYTKVDLNRAGVPLIEIVTDPVIANSEVAALFLSEIRKLVRYLEISDGNMEEGSLRCDANVSVHQPGTPLGSKVEIKNMNSIRNVRKAIEVEIQRQIDLLEAGQIIKSETRSYDPQTLMSSEMRTKEELNDYRYFTEPDLSPLLLTDDWIQKIKDELPPLPGELKQKLMKQYDLPEYDATVLTEDKAFCRYFLDVCEHTSNYKKVSNWMMGRVKSFLKENGIEITAFSLAPKTLAELIDLIEEGKVSKNNASQKLFPHLLGSPDIGLSEAIIELHLDNETGQDNVQQLVDEVLDRFPDKVKAYHNGKKGLTGLFMGELMKVSAGKVNPKEANQLITDTLESRR